MIEDKKLDIHKTLAEPFWINDFQIDPEGLVIKGKSGSEAIEPKVMQVLLILSSAPGKVIKRQTLIEQIWEAPHGSDESLTRAISLLRKHLGDTNGRRKIIETIPRRGYRLIGIVAVHALSDDDTAATINATAPICIPPSPSTIVDSDNDISINDRPLLASRFLMFRSLVACLGLVILLGLLYLMVTSQTDQVVEYSQSIQVTPINITPQEQVIQSFAVSLRSQITSVLLQNSIQTTFEEGDLRRPQKFSITGNLEYQNTTLHATINLIDVPTKTVIWSGLFNRPKNQLANFGDEITAKSANLIRCMLQLRTDAFDAAAEKLVLYARFCDSTSQSSMANFLLLTEPIYLAEPNNNSAISLHAYALGRRSEWTQNLSTKQRQHLMTRARDLINSITDWAPDSPFKQFLLASSTPMVGNWADIEEKLIRATSKLRMPDIVYLKYAFHLRIVGRLKAATNIYTDLVALNPVNAENLAELGWLHFSQQDPITAEQFFMLAERYDPHSDILAIRRFQAEVFLGEPHLALQQLQRAPLGQWRPSTQNTHCVKTYAEAKKVDTPDLPALERACVNAPPYWSIRMFTALGDIDRAFRLAEEFGFQSPGHTLILFYPDMAPFRNDQRFWDIAKQSGLLNYWLKTKHWPDFCETDNLNVSCEVSAESVTNKSI